MRDDVFAEIPDRGRDGACPTLTIDSSDGATFPRAWYFRDVPEVGHLDFSVVAQPRAGDIVVTTDATRTHFAQQLARHRGRILDFRV